MTGDPETRPPLDLTRPMIESEIERLLSILDWLDPDPDIEDEGDGEPWLGAPEARTGSWSGLWPEGNDDREADEADDEPELGSLDHVNQTRWSKGKDAEPSLGSLDLLINQMKWSKGGTKDFEDEHDGREPCCEDEGAQCDDEGWVEEDRGADEDEIPRGVNSWGADYEEQEATARACQGAIARVRHLQQRNGQKPVQPLRVLCGAIMKGGGT